MSNLDYILFGDPPVASPGSGSVDDRVIGTGNAFPSFPGLVQYNGLLMNDLQSYDYFHINNIDGLDDAELRDFRSSRPFDDGEDLYGSLYSGRPVVINGEIRAYDVWKTDDMREALQTAFALNTGFGNPNVEKPLWFRRGSTVNDRLIYCKKNAKIEIPHTLPTKQSGWVPFMVPLRASDPRMLSYLLHSVSQAGEGSTLVNNAGNFPSKALLRFYGPCTRLTLQRHHGGLQQTVIVGPISSGNYIEVLGSRIRDQNGDNAYDRYSDDSDKLTLGKTDNVIEVTGTGLGSGSGVTIQWRDSWV
jgi:hypothetical protein